MFDMRQTTAASSFAKRLLYRSENTVHTKIWSSETSPYIKLLFMVSWNTLIYLSITVVTTVRVHNVPRESRVSYRHLILATVSIKRRLPDYF